MDVPCLGMRGRWHGALGILQGSGLQRGEAAPPGGQEQGVAQPWLLALMMAPRQRPSARGTPFHPPRTGSFSAAVPTRLDHSCRWGSGKGLQTHLVCLTLTPMGKWEPGSALGT